MAKFLKVNRKTPDGCSGAGADWALYFYNGHQPLVGASPIITLNGEEEMQVECGSEFVDPGVKASAKDEDISDLVMTTSNVDTSKLGTYHVEYQLKYKKRKVSRERIVKVIDHAAPVIALNGDATVIVGSFEEYQEAGATAQDAVTVMCQRISRSQKKK